MSEELRNKPLVEAILEIKWLLGKKGVLSSKNSNFKLFLGCFFDKIRGDYPEYEELPAANIPEEFAGHVVQHRFRVQKNSWPLLQIGPGIATLNSTEEYERDEFKRRANVLVEKLYEAWLGPKEELKIEQMVLRYIDAVEFDYRRENVFEFLKDKLKTKIELLPDLFEGENIEARPESLEFKTSFRNKHPKGMVQLSFSTGQKNRNPAVIWETIITSAKDDVLDMPSQFKNWLSDAHGISHDWFFKLIDGDLKRRFQGE